MEVPQSENWQLWQSSSNRHVWRHEEHSLWMIISYQPDHYDENGEQIMRVHGRAKYGTKMDKVGNITFGENIFVIVNNSTEKQEAFEKVLEWAKNWMDNYEKGKFDIEF